MLDNTLNQLSKFRIKNWFEINDDSRGTYNTNSQIKFKTAISKSSLCDYSDAYIFDKRRLKITGAANSDGARQVDKRNKGILFKNCASCTNYISKINNTQKESAKDLDVVMLMYNLIK